jgi:hypothetical protein
MKTIDEALAIYFTVVEGKTRLKMTARDQPGGVPSGSRWFPGCPGDPTCEECEGTGYIRLEVPPGHPACGRIFLCSCVAGRLGNG